MPSAPRLGGSAATGSVPREEQLAALLPGFAHHPNPDYPTLAYHGEQSDATARDGYFHEAINEAQCGFPSCSRYLEEIGLFNLEERVMVGHTYGLDRAGGIREGVGDEAWSRLVRRMIWTAAQYVIQPYNAWTSGCRCWSGSAASSDGPMTTEKTKCGGGARPKAAPAGARRFPRAAGTPAPVFDGRGHATRHGPQ